MRTISDHINHVKGKPHHVRRRVAFSAAAAGSGLIALIWLVGSVSLGTFAIAPTSFADSVGAVSAIATDSTGGNESLAAAAASFLSGEQVPAHIEIVDTASSTKANKQVEQTTIPF